MYKTHAMNFIEEEEGQGEEEKQGRGGRGGRVTVWAELNWRPVGG